MPVDCSEASFARCKRGFLVFYIRTRRDAPFFPFLFGLLMLLALVVAPVPASAQNVSSGNVIGQVTDQQGAAVPDAEVRLIDVATNTPHTTMTNTDGRYTFNNVPIGSYDLEVRKQGFAMTRVANQAVDVGSVLTLNVTLQVGTAATTIEVQAQAGAELQTTNATVGTTITGAAIDALPNLGRDANAFVVLQPGVSPTGEVGGLPVDASMFQLDGGNNTNDMDGSMSTYTPSSGYVGTQATGGVCAKAISGIDASVSAPADARRKERLSTRFMQTPSAPSTRARLQSGKT